MHLKFYFNEIEGQSNNINLKHFSSSWKKLNSTTLVIWKYNKIQWYGWLIATQTRENVLHGYWLKQMLSMDKVLIY